MTNIMYTGIEQLLPVTHKARNADRCSCCCGNSGNRSVLFQCLISLDSRFYQFWGNFWVKICTFGFSIKKGRIREYCTLEIVYCIDLRWLNLNIFCMLSSALSMSRKMQNISVCFWVFWVSENISEKNCSLANMATFVLSHQTDWLFPFCLNLKSSI